MAHFEIGKKVIAIDNHSYMNFRKGDVFELLGIQKGCSHYPIILNIETSADTYCPKCSKNFNGSWYCASSFAPYDDSLSEHSIESLLEEISIAQPQKV